MARNGDVQSATICANIDTMHVNDSFKYCPLYCEENIWHLCQQPRFDLLATKVMFISNPNKSCAIWHQRSAASQGLPVVWDYHVVLLIKTNHWRVWDLDSNLPLGISLLDYLGQSFVQFWSNDTTKQLISRDLDPLFYLIDGTKYVSHFDSQRQHMLDKQGQWLAPPPPWPAIESDQKLTLEVILDNTRRQGLSLNELSAWVEQTLNMNNNGK